MIQLPKGAPERKRLAVGAAIALILILVFFGLFGGGDETSETASAPPGGAAEPSAKAPLPPDADPGADGGFTPLPSPISGMEPETAPSATPGVSPERKPEKRPAPAAPPKASDRPRGLTFLDGVVEPLQSELDRFWGWRPNDLIQFTDNVNNFQLGVLEATRRTSIALAERISRSGSSDPYVRELERAMSLFAIDPRTWIFPRPESKYQEGLDNIRKYGEMVGRGEAPFYNRMDNLVPLLLAYESILGSCTENLLRRDVGFFQADDVFFYSQGVVTMVLSAMKGVGVDFRETIEAAQAFGVYSEIIVSLERMAEMDPPVILNSGPDSIFANHRSNMAGLMSRARFLIHIFYGALTGDL
ncbi:MAG: DUF2333 family protein [Desulfococcaceae bacterium]